MDDASRRKPGFLVLLAGKCDPTSLDHDLDQHLGVRFSRAEEPVSFDSGRLRNLEHRRSASQPWRANA